MGVMHHLSITHPREDQVMARSTSCAVASLALLMTACANEPTAVTQDRDRPVAAALRPDVKATTVGCGATLLTDLKLESDLVCPGDAIIVGADGITVDLSGHTISGAGVGVGVTVRARQGVTVRGGQVRGFLTGIFVTQSTDIVISHNELTQTREGIFFAGTTGSVIKNNVAWANQLRGIMIRPTGAGALATDNRHRGERVARQSEWPSGLRSARQHVHREPHFGQQRCRARPDWWRGIGERLSRQPAVRERGGDQVRPRLDRERFLRHHARGKRLRHARHRDWQHASGHELSPERRG